MVRGNYKLSADLNDGVRNGPDALVHRFYGCHCRVENACVAYHVAVGQVHDNKIQFSALYALQNLFRNQICAHLRLKIVGGYLRRRHKYALLAFVGLLHASVEEERNVSVLFRLGYAKLLKPKRGNVLAQSIVQGLRFERDGNVGDGSVVYGKAYVAQILKHYLARKSVEVRIHEAAGYLPCPVRAEVEEYYGIAVMYGVAPYAAAVLLAAFADGAFCNYAGLYELVGLAVFSGPFHKRLGGKLLKALAGGVAVVGLFHALPALVSVHGVEAAGDGRDLTCSVFLELLLKLFYVFFRAGRGNVPSVQYAVHEHVLKSALSRHADKSVEVLVVRMHAAVGKKAHYVKGVSLGCVVHGADKLFVLKEAAVLYGIGDPGKFLPDNSAGAHVGVAYLGVAHLAVRKAHGSAACLKLSVRVLSEKLIQIGRLCCGYGVSGSVRGNAEAVHYKKHNRSAVCHSLTSVKSGSDQSKLST